MNKWKVKVKTTSFSNQFHHGSIRKNGKLKLNNKYKRLRWYDHVN